MGTTWVLHTETKGTGANMVPLERITNHPRTPTPLVVAPKRRTPRKETPKPRARRRFRVLDVMTRQHLVENGNPRETMEALETVRSVVDVNIYIWDEEQERWLLLPFSEQRAMLELARVQRRDQRDPALAPAA